MLQQFGHWLELDYLGLGFGNKHDSLYYMARALVILTHQAQVSRFRVQLPRIKAQISSSLSYSTAHKVLQTHTYSLHVKVPACEIVKLEDEIEAQPEFLARKSLFCYN